MKKRIYNQPALFGPLYAYLVVLSPPEEISQEIRLLKKQLNEIESIGEQNLHSIGHITLIDKLTDDSMLAETIGLLLEGQHRFTVKLEGFGTFDHGTKSTLFVKVQNHDPILGLMRLLRITSGHPHLSLAKRIPNDKSKLLYEYLQTVEFKSEWVCKEVTVLRKLMSEKELGFREKFKITLV